MSDAALRLSGIACARGGRMLFRGVDLSLQAGGSALLRGPNGIGKSSLMRICAGLLRPMAGTIERRGRIALADERLALEMEEPLRAALGFWARLDGVNAAALDRALDAMALGPLADIPVRMLSTGQRKRASLARVIAGGAPLWLLDEPGNGLDDASLALLGTAVAAHLAGGGIVVAASHQPLPMTAPAIVELADYVAEDAA
ncbi:MULTISPECIES: heme ABC exporter ATP-binding protein CcmA [Sphingobium]|uniref:Heme ABC exporter ATP-binding protein CcmA n=1 Tax=Sphingobium tyrosinilyticum TaxID=2715436 RepID=A0ABV9F3H3_9SPHN|nr:heme ABC exporter ATP-binding protein CcmA [Sphingobium sp. EP60837]ANI78610.1 Cytochrome c bioproteinis ATP-binding export protein CcmA [Sphingobium sp. EP60837]